MGRYISILIAVLAMIYFSIAPVHIQGGDTAELVTSAHHLLVPHPPGYPLNLWLQFLWTHIFPAGTLFWKASLLSAMFGLLTLIIIGKISSRWTSLLLVLTLGTYNEFVESSVLPDVFSLHALLVSLFLYVFLYVEERGHFLVPFLFFLSAANHHTTVFLIPCLILCFVEAFRKNEMRKYCTGFLSGVLFTTCLYLTLLFCHPEHPLSWGSVTSFESLISHVLRKDYGTFRLSVSEVSAGIAPWLFLMKSLLPLAPVFLMAIYGLAKNRMHIVSLRFYALTVTLILTLLFPLFMNISPDHIGSEVLRRFHVMPLVIFIIWLIHVFTQIEFTKRGQRMVLLSLVPVLGLNLYGLKDFLQLRNDSVIEDYARNLFETGKKNQPSLIFTDTDTSFFGVRYFMVEDPEQQIAAVSAPLLFHPWFQSKLKKQFPSLVIPPHIAHEKFMNLSSDIVKPNLAAVNFVMVKDYKGDEWYKVVFHKLGRVVKKGEGIEFDDEEISFYPYDLNEGPQHFTKAYLHSHYSHFYMARSYSRKDEEEASISDLKNALAAVPYAYYAKEQLCEKKQLVECSEKDLNALKERTLYIYQAME